MLISHQIVLFLFKSGYLESVAWDHYFVGLCISTTFALIRTPFLVPSAYGLSSWRSGRNHELPLLQKTMMSLFLHTASLGFWSVAGHCRGVVKRAQPLKARASSASLAIALGLCFSHMLKHVNLFSLPAYEAHSIQEHCPWISSGSSSPLLGQACDTL